MNITSEKLKAVLDKFGVNLTDDVDLNSIEVKESSEVAERLNSLQSLLKSQLALIQKRNRAETDLQKIDFESVNYLKKKDISELNELNSDYNKANDANVEFNEIEESDNSDNPKNSNLSNRFKNIFKNPKFKFSAIVAGLTYLILKSFKDDSSEDSDIDDINQYKYEKLDETDSVEPQDINISSNSSEVSNQTIKETKSEYKDKDIKDSTNLIESDEPKGFLSKFKSWFRFKRAKKQDTPIISNNMNIDFNKLKGDNTKGYTLKGGYLTKSQRDANMNIIMDYLHNEMKLPIPAVVAIAGNIAQESGANPGSYNKGEKAGTYKGSRANGPDYGAGIIQWTGVGNNPGVGDRKLKMEKYLGKKVEDSTLLEQLAYLKYEMNTSLSRNYQRFLTEVKSTSDINKLTSAWLATIEMPGLWKYYKTRGNTAGKGEESKRINYAKYYYSILVNNQNSKLLANSGTEADIVPQMTSVTINPTKVQVSKNLSQVSVIELPKSIESIKTSVEESKQVETRIAGIHSPTNEIHNDVVNNIYEL